MSTNGSISNIQFKVVRCVVIAQTWDSSFNSLRGIFVSGYNWHVFNLIPCGNKYSIDAFSLLFAATKTANSLPWIYCST